MQFKYILPSSLMLSVFLLTSPLLANVGNLPGSIAATPNATATTLNISVARGKNFSIPSSVPINYYALCPTVDGLSAVWSIQVSIPVTFACGCTSNPIITLGIESNTPPQTTAVGAYASSFTVSVSKVTSSSFLYNVLSFVTACDASEGVPLSVAQAFTAGLVAGGPVVLNFNASCVK